MKKVLFVISLSVMVPAFGAEVLTRPVVQEESLKEQEQALWSAVRRVEDTKDLVELLDGGMSPNSTCRLEPFRTKVPVLSLAILAGNVAAVKELVKRGADLNACNGEDPAIHYAVQEGHLEVVKEIVELLLNAGADINALDGCGQTPLDHCLLSSMRSLFRDHGAKLSSELK